MRRCASAILYLSLGCAAAPEPPIPPSAPPPVPAECTAAIPAAPLDATAQLDFGHHLADVGDPAAAVPHYRCALALNPKLDAARISLAAQLIDEQQYAAARREIQKISATPDSRIRSLLAMALEGMGDLSGAAAQLARAADEAQTSAVLYRRASELYLRAGDEVRAAELKAEADQLDPPPELREMRPLVEAKPPPSPKKKKQKKKRRR